MGFVVCIFAFLILYQELAQEADKTGEGRGLEEVTWTLAHLEQAMLQSIGRSPAKNPATNAAWPAIKSLADVLQCRCVSVQHHHVLHVVLHADDGR